MDVVDVIPRSKEKIIKQRGLGNKAGRFFWIEVDTEGISDHAFNALAEQLLEPELEQITVLHSPLKGELTRPKLLAKRKNRLDTHRLAALDENFNAATAVRTHDASRIYPKRVLTVRQLRRMIKNKRTGRYLYGD
jgi:hypothetical protein